MSEEQTEVSVTTPAGGFSAKSKYMAEIVALVLSGGFVGGTIFLYKHDEQSQGLFKELILTNRQMVEAQREMNCLIALPQEKREAEYTSNYGLCKRLSR